MALFDRPLFAAKPLTVQWPRTTANVSQRHLNAFRYAYDLNMFQIKTIHFFLFLLSFSLIVFILDSKQLRLYPT